jgi:tryptophan synthase alpha chain
MTIDQLFKANENGLLNIFFTAGYPKLESTISIAQSLDKAGVKIVEIGMPFSDPLADGTTIQHSSEIALKNGMNLDLLFEQVNKINATTKLSIILMGYLNQMMSVGVDNFLETCNGAGVIGLIIPDLPMDIYESEYKNLFRKHGIDISFLITPRTSEERIRLADRLSSGFLYMVADNSITGGMSGQFNEKQLEYFDRIKNMDLTSPILVGFGIKTSNQYNITCEYANGSIIGSEFIRMLSSAEKINEEYIAEFVNSIIQSKKG